MEAQELMLLRSWLEPNGSADSYVRIDADNYGSTDEHTYTHLDLKIADCQRHIRLGFFVDSQKPQTKAKALAKAHEIKSDYHLAKFKEIRNRLKNMVSTVQQRR